MARMVCNSLCRLCFLLFQKMRNDRRKQSKQSTAGYVLAYGAPWKITASGLPGLGMHGVSIGIDSACPSQNVTTMTFG